MLMSIQLNHLVKSFDGHVAVDGLQLEVRAGEVFGFLGPNGAGKSTTIRMIVGLLRPTSGAVLIDGHDVQQAPALAKRAIGYVPDEPHLFDGLTGREFLQFIGELYEVPRDERRERSTAMIDRFDLEEHLDQWIGSYSHGTRQKLAITGALIHNPRNLLLDEPTVGLDPKSAYALKETLREQAAQGNTVFLSTHILEIAEGLCDRIGILDHGKLLAVGTLDELRHQASSPASSLEAIFLTLTDRGASTEAVRP